MEVTNTRLVGRPRRLMLYGVQGIGKSTFGAGAPNALFMRTEDGLGDIDAIALPLATSMGDVREQLAWLLSEENETEIGTLVVDSLDWLERLIWADVCAAGGKANIEEFGYGKGYVLAANETAALLATLEKIQQRRSCNIVLLAHSQISKFEDPEGPSYDRYSPRLHRHASAIVQEWCDDVLFATRKVVHVKENEGFGRTRARASSTRDDERVMYSQDRPARCAKTRCANMPEELPLVWDAYQYYAIDGKGEQEPEPETKPESEPETKPEKKGKTNV